MHIRSANPQTRFWAKVIKRNPDECWPWTAARTGGYGYFGLDGRLVYAHRLSWEWANGQRIPDGMWILHSCDNPPCVNPAHLSLGTQLDDVRDMDRKGRRGYSPHRSRNQHTDKTHCIHGHALTPENAYVSFTNTGPHRHCKECGRQRSREYQKRKRATKR